MLDKVVLVKTPRGVWGFPKGKREKKDSSIIDCAYRELNEETSLEEKHFVPHTNLVQYEVTKKGVPSVALFTGIAFKEYPVKCCDGDELEGGDVSWVPVDKAIGVLTIKNRAQILQNALSQVHDLNPNPNP